MKTKFVKWFRDIAKYKDNYYFVQEECPLLFKMNIYSEEVSVEADLSKFHMIKQFNYREVICKDDSLYIIPQLANNFLLKYDLISNKFKCIKFINLEEELYVDGHFCIGNNIIVLFGNMTITAIDVITDEVKVLDTAYKKMKKYKKENEKPLVRSGIIKDNKIIMGCTQADVLFVVDMETEEVLIKELNIGIEGYETIIYDSQGYWMLSFNGNYLVKLDENYQVIKKIVIKLENTKRENFRGAFCIGKELILVPWLNQHFVCINKDIGEQYSLNGDICLNNVITSAVMYDDEIVAVHKENNGYEFIRVKNGRLQIIKPLINEEVQRLLFNACRDSIILEEQVSLNVFLSLM